MKVYRVKGSPDHIVELLEMTLDGKVKVRNINDNEIIEITQQVFEMVFEPSNYSFIAHEKARTQPKNQKITQTDIDGVLEKSQMEIVELFGRCTVVAVQLPNGFIITESNTSADAASYNKDENTRMCLERIKNRILELEGYKYRSLLLEYLKG